MKILVLFLCVLAAQAQQIVNGNRTFLGTVNTASSTGLIVRNGTTAPSSGDCDASGEKGNLYVRTGDQATVPTEVSVCTQIGASSWAWMPISHKVGTTTPATCAQGTVFFKTDATAGQNLYFCTTADNWTQMTGGSSSSTSTAFAPTRETGSAANDTLRLNCDTAPYCTQTINRVIAFNATTDITFKISASPSYTGNVYIYYTPSAQTIYCDQGSAGLTLTLAGCTAATTGGIPAGSVPVGKYNGTYAVTSNVFADPSTSPVAPTVWARTLSGTGVDCSDNGTTGEQTCVTDPLVPLKSQIQGQGLIYAASTGSSNAYLLTTSPSFSANANGVCVEFKANFTNSGTATLAVNGGIARELWKHNGTSAAAAAASGEIISGQTYRACHNTTLNTSGVWEVRNIGGGASGGASPLTTKGDLYTYSTVDARLPVGSNGTVPLAASGETTGIKWGYLTRSEYFGAIGCSGDGGTASFGGNWGVIVGSAPGYGCGGGYTSGLATRGFMTMANGSTQLAAFNWRLPSNFQALVSVTIHAANGTNTGDVMWRYGAMCFSSSDSFLTGTPSFTDDSDFADTVPGTTFAEKDIVHATTNVDSCAAGGRLVMKMGRIGEAGGDSNGNDSLFFGITIEYTVKAQ